MWEHAITALEHDQDRLETTGGLDRQAQAHRAVPGAAHNLSLAHPRIALMDLAYHDVNRKRGLYYILERRGIGRAHVRRGGHRAGDPGATSDDPGQACAASSSARPSASGATSRSTGSI